MVDHAEEVIHADSGEADASTIHHAASKIASLMDGTPSIDTTHPEQETAEQTEEPVLEVVEEPTEEAEEQTESVSEDVEDLITNFSDIADHLGVEESYLESLIVPTKVNGEEKTASIKDLVASFQKGESADVKLMELADQRKQFNSELSNAKDQLQQEWGRAQALNTELQSMLTGDEDNQISNLRHSDPAEYAAQMADRQSRLQRAQKIQGELQVENNTKMIGEYQHRLTTERAKLFEAIPAWSDDKVRNEETVQVRKYLKSEGFQDFEIDGKIENGQLVHAGMIDHRAMVIAQKAMLYDQARKGSEPKKTRLKALPKVGAGKPKGKSDVADAKKSEIRGRVRKSGSINDAALAIKQLMEN